MSDIKCSECPECGCSEYKAEDYLGDGYRACLACHQEWWTHIDYTDTQKGTCVTKEVLVKEVDSE